jgi:hypothetical protein
MVAAMRSPKGASAETLRQVLQGQIIVAASVPMYMEHEAVMTRSEHLEAICSLAKRITWHRSFKLFEFIRCIWVCAVVF